MVEYVKQILAPQFEASLCMMNECVRKCPDEHWDGLIAKYPFWQVVYHTLCFVDLYLSPNEAAFEPRAIHPRGYKELDDEYPTRRFDRLELGGYLLECLQKMRQVLAAETAATLAGASGFHWLTFSRAELHLYNLRHVQHHTGQLTAFLRKVGVDTDWVSAGWR